MKNKSIFFYQFIAVCIFAYTMNFINIRSIQKNNPANTEQNARSLVNNETIFSIDNEWYLNQIKNLQHGYGFTHDTSNYLYTVRRTPLYPLFYGAHYLIFGEKGSFAAIKYSQIIIFGISAVFLFLATLNFTNSRKIAWLTYILYGFNLPLISYLSFTLTEAVFPALICFILYFLSRCKLSSNGTNWFMVGLFYSIAVLTRPNIVFILSTIIFCILYYNKFVFKKIITNGCFFVFGLSLLFTPWVIRNYIKTNGDIVILEKYYGDQMDYGMPNMHLKYWIACWINPADYSSERISNCIIKNINDNEPVSGKELVDSLLNTIPPVVFKGNNKNEIKDSYSVLYDYYKAKKINKNSHEFYKIEKKSILLFKNMKSDFITKAPLQYFILTPLSYLKSLIFQSNSSTLIYLEDFKTDKLAWVIKFCLFLLNIFCFTAIPLLLFYKKHTDIFWSTFLFSASTIFIIFFVNKNFEARYIFQLFPYLFISLSVVCIESYERIKLKLNF